MLPPSCAPRLPMVSFPLFWSRGTKQACFNCLSAINSGMAPSTSGLGRSPLKAKTRVRIPLGLPLISIGCKVTLRGRRMYDFVDKLINILLPRVRDFRGVSPQAFDGRGNYSLGVKEQTIFPEIEYDKIDKIRGLGIVLVTTAKTDEEARELLRSMGMPFR